MQVALNIPPAWARWLYPVASATGTWGLVRAMRLAWLRWCSRQLPIADMRQQELWLERRALELLP